jgi:hypothetical protein
MDPDIDPILVRYLLGELSESEERDLEQHYLQDRALFEQLQVAETELVDAYARGELGPRERGALESRFLLTPRGRETAALSRALHHLAAEATGQRRSTAGSRAGGSRSSVVAGWAPGSRWVLPTAAVLLCATALVFWRTRFDAVPQNRPAAGPAQSETVAPAPRRDLTMPAGRESGVVALALSPGLLRGQGSTRTLELPPGTRLVRLDLDVQTAVPERCHVTVTTVEGTIVLRAPVPNRPSPTTVQIDIPADSLSAGDYILTLSADAGQGVPEGVADFFFRVVKQ